MNKTALGILITSLLIAPYASIADNGDSYNASNNTLSIPSIIVGNTTYNNVVINVGSIVSIGSSTPVCVLPQVLTSGQCVTPVQPPTISVGGLTWMKISSTQYNFAQATALCAGTINGLTGWRLPTLVELSAFSSAYPFNSTAYWTIVNQGWELTSVWSSVAGANAWGASNSWVTTHNLYFFSNGNIMSDIDTDSNQTACVR